MLSNVGSFMTCAEETPTQISSALARKNRFASFSATGETTTAASALEAYNEARDWFYQNVE